MSTKKEEVSDAELRKEFAELKEQVLAMTELLKQKGLQEGHEIKNSIKENYEEVKEKAKDHLDHAQEVSADSLEKVVGKVRQNPFASLIIAFGLGYLISKTFKNDA